jgi:hypothetical protein
MTASLTPLLKLLIWSSVIALAVGLYFFENITGYYRFQEICQKEAGLRIYRPLVRNVGWVVDAVQIENATFPLLFEQVAFTRYRNEKDGNMYDIYRVPKAKVVDLGYAQQYADVSNLVGYQFSIKTLRLPDETRMGVQIYEVKDVKNNEVVAKYSRFTYSKFDVNNTLLAAPSGEACPEDLPATDPKTGKRLPTKIEVAFSSAFAN